MIRPYLVPVVLLIASTASMAQPPGGQSRGLRLIVANPPASTTQASSQRQLSAQELAELRKLLAQNSRHAGKGS